MDLEKKFTDVENNGALVSLNIRSERGDEGMHAEC